MRGGALAASVVVPVYDRTHLLEATVLSIFRQETDHSFEVILVTDGSPDATRNTVRSLQEQAPVPVRVFGFTEPSGSACRPRNLGIVQARGEYVFFSDSDDFNQPWRLQRTLEAARTGDYDVVAGRARYLQDGSRTVDGIVVDPVEGYPVSQAPEVTLGMLRLGNPIVLSTAAVRRSALLLHGGFRVGLSYREDHELWLRLCLAGARFHMLDEVLVDYLIHSGNNELAFSHEDEHWLASALASSTAPFTNADWGLQ